MFTVLITTVSFAVASDVSDNMTVSEVDDQDTIELTNIQENALGEGQKSFEQLDEVIHNESVPEGGLIELDANYTFSDGDSASVGTSGISITKDVTIDGKGYTLNASSKASLFRIAGNSHVILKNIVFTDGNGTDGGAIYVESGSTIEVIGCTFQNNFALNNGGAIFMADDSLSSSSSIQDSIFTGNQANDGGSIYVTSSTINVARSNFSHDNATRYGGSIYSGGAVHISQTTFDHESASSGGAIELFDDDDNYSTIENSEFKNCYATGDGGACYIRTDNVIVENVTFTDNIAGDDGGALYWEGSDGIIYNITCSNNKGVSRDKNETDTSSTRGGTICLTGSNVKISKSSFASSSAYMDEGKNSSKVDGGALFITGNGVVLEDITFTDCNATNAGGAVYIIGNNTHILNCNFDNCNAKDGAALYVNGSGCELRDSTFTDNLAAEDGGAIYWQGDYGSIYGSRFENNMAVGFGDKTNYTEVYNPNTNVTEKRYNVTGGEGGAIMWKGSHGLIEGSTFYKNTAGYSGGAIYLIGDGEENCTNITFRDCNFTQNTAKLNGGAINWASGASNATVTGSHFFRNTAYRSAGAIYVSGNNLEIKDTDFRYNEATQQTTYDNRSSAGVFTSEGGNAGAICWMGSFGTVDNGTFVSNTARVRGGAIQFERNQNGTVKNSRFTDNTAGTDGGAIDWYQGASNGQILNSNFTNNGASEDGGGVYIEGNDCKVFDSNFITSRAADEGGALYVIGNRTQIANCGFDDSRSKDGAALFVNGTGCELYNSTFTNSIAEDDGGAIFWEGDDGVMYNITCINNKGISYGTSSSRGGTICLTGDNVIVNKSTFKTSSVSIAAGRVSDKIDGGALFITGNNIKIIDTDFDDCNATNFGGAIYIMGNDTHLLNCNYTNTKALVGGGIYISGNDAVVDDSLFRHNDAKGAVQSDGGTGGAIYVDGKRAFISNSDFAFDTAVRYGGAISVWGSDAIITNNTFDNSTATEFYGGAIFVNGFNATISYSNFTRSKTINQFTRGGAIDVGGDNANILGCNFEDCYSYFGGDIYVNGANAIINGSNFEHTGVYNKNYPYEGGAIFVNGAYTTILKSNFTDFNCIENGGAIYVAGTNTNISESNFQECTANGVDKAHGGSGGAIYIAGEDTNIEKSNFTSSKALNTDSRGGAICIQGANTLIKESSFDDCEAKRGGDIYVFGNGARIEDSEFNLSHANYGGAIYLEAWGAVIKQSNVSECYATNNGGAIYVAGGGTNIIGSSFEFCTSEGTSSNNGGGAIFISGPDTHISGSEFNNNVVPGSARGGAIYILGERTIIDGSEFNGSSAKEGGIICIEGGQTLIDSSTFANSSSKVKGGAISIYGHDATIRGSHFENIDCYVSGNQESKGGAIFVDGENTNILTSSFDYCTAKTSGGAIYIADLGATVAYSNFTYAHANTGGAIYIDGVNTTITYCNINNNTATSAGAIKVSGNDSYISNCNISDNRATSGVGGAVDIGGERASVLYSNFTFNKATGNGGAINWEGGHGSDSIIGTTFVNNTCTGPQGGGAIFWDQGKTIASGGLIKDCIFINNSAYNKHGGALNWYRTLDSTIDNCLFINNYASSDGGALYTGDQNGNSRNLTFINSQFYNNTAAKHGGAISNQMAESYIFNITFDGNKAGYSGGTILMKEGPAKDTIIDHCYIYNSYCNQHGDTYGDGGGAIHIQDNNITISNCAIINSTTGNTFGGAISFEKKSGSASRACSYASLINVTIQNVAANGGNGGAIYWSGDYGYMYNVTIFNASSNSKPGSEANGGAIYISGANGNFNNVTIASSSSNNNDSSNSNPANGGAIYVSGKTNTFTNVTIDDSQASSVRMDANGGAIYWSGSSGSLINASISNTLANGKGGAIYWIGSAKTFENVSIEYSQTNVTSSTTIEDNGCGGAIYTTTINELKNVYIIDALASTESGDIKGGAIYFAGSKMNNVTVIDSHAVTGEGTSYGGAVYLLAGSTTDIHDSMFSANSADLGGAVFSDRKINVYNTLFIGNVALDGGAIYVQTGDISLTDSTFELNSAKRGGAIFTDDVHLKIDDSTLRNNTAEEKGGAIYHNYVSKTGTTYIKNSDLVNNTAFQGSAIYTTKFFALTNVVLLDNQANSKEFIEKHVGVDETGRNYTSAVFVGFDNVLNAIWVVQETIDIACRNVTYWGVNGVNVSNSVPRRSDREVWQNVTVEMFNDNGEKINEVVVVTDADGRCIYYFDAEDNEDYYFAFTHETDRYYTYLRDTLSNRSLVKIYAYTPIFYGQNQTILISLTDGAWGELNGTVIVTVKGPFNATYEVEVINGTYTRSNISGLPMGIYNVTAEFNGDLDHTGSSDWVLFEVLPYDDLHITKTVNITADYVNVTDIIQYNVTVTNHGPSGARGVNVTEVLSPYLKLLDNQTTKGYYNYTNGTWFIGDLDVDETVTLTIIAQIIHMGPITNAVWVYGLGNETDLTNNNASAHNFTALPILDLRIVKDVDVEGDIINVLDLITFTITVFNDGPCNATGVFVAEALDFNLMIVSNHTTLGTYAGDTWTIGEMPNGTNATLTIVAQVIYSGNITNAVHVYGYENETDYENNHAEIRNITAIANVDVGISKKVNVTGFVNVTDIIRFDISVYNNGPCNATGVYVSEILDYVHLEHISNSTTKGHFDGYSWIIDTLNVGEVANLTIIVNVTNVGNFGNVVSVFTSDNDTDLSNNNASIDNITSLPIIDLAITKVVTVGGSVVNVTDDVVFEINVTNKGPWAATNVTVVEVLSPHLQMISYDTWMGSYNVTSGIWYIGDMRAGEEVSIVIMTKVISPGIISNVVVVNGTENDTNLTNNIDEIENITALPIVDLGIVKEVNVTVANVTDKVRFTINVTNYGPCNATNVNVSEVLNHNLRLISNVTDYGHYNVTEGIWHIGNLTNGSMAVLTLTCEVTGNDTIVNYVNVTSSEKDTYLANNEYLVTFVTYSIVDLSVVKQVNVTSSDFVYLGDRIEFTVTVHNAGPSNATGVYVEEFLDTHLKLIYYNATKGSYDNFTWTIGKMNNGSTENLTIVAEVIALGNITNAATVYRTENDTNASNDHDSIDNITVEPIVDLQITKEVIVGADVVNVTDEIEFKVTVKNNGPCDATNVTVVEVLSPHLHMESYDTWMGQYNVTTGIWYIGDLPNGYDVYILIWAKVVSEGIISNVVVVNSTEIDTNESNNIDEIENITALPVVDLGIVKEVNVTVANVTDKVRFTINVTNYGPCNATNVNVSEVLNHNLRLISNVTEYGHYNVTEGIWHIGNLNNGSTAVLTLTCEVTGNDTIVNYVNVTSYEKDTYLANNEYSVTLITHSIVDLSITKSVNVTSTDIVYFGDRIEFTVTAHNAGPSNATGVYVEEFLDTHLKLIYYNATKGSYDNFTWTIGKMNNGSTETLTIVAEVIALGNISNAVTVYRTENDTNASNDHDSIDNITVMPVVDVAITKTPLYYDKVVNVGDLLQFNIDVKNYGPCDATNVTVSEVLSPLLKITNIIIYRGNYNATTGIWYIGNLPINGTAQLIIQAQVISNGTLSNFVSVNSTEHDIDLSNNNDTIENVTIAPIVDLIIVKEVNQTFVNVTKEIKFTITVINDGPCNATQVNVSEELGNHLRFISADTAHGYYNVTEGIWHIGDLTNHTNATLIIICEAVRDGNFINYVNVTCSERDIHPENDHFEVPFTILRIVDVSVTKEASATLVNVTNEIVFTITVHNSGPSNATDVRVSEALDSHLSLVSFNVTTGYYMDSIWYVGDLNNGSTETMTITVKVISEGNISNFVSVNSTENDTDLTNNRDNVTNITALCLVDVAITKSASIWSTSDVAIVGDVIQFTINVNNYGPCDATNVTVVEKLSELLNMTSYSISGPGDYNVTTGIWYIGNLPDKGFAQLIILTKVISDGNISNFVSVNSTENDTDLSNNNDTIKNITAVPAINLVIVKDVNASVVTVGDLIEFNITVYNMGPSNATLVNVSEVLDTNFRLISNATDVGYFNLTGGYWYIGDLNVGSNATLTLVCELTDDGIFRNYVEVYGFEYETYPYDNWDDVYVSTVPIVDVSITKEINVNSTVVNVGETIEFTITVHNAGPSKATSVLVSESILAPLRLISNHTSVGSYDGFTWNVGELANNATETMTLVCEVMYKGNISNFVNVTSYQNDTNMSNNYANITNITAAVNVDVGVNKTVNVTRFVNVYDYIEFNITVYNCGSYNATSVSLIEFFDYDHLEYISNSTTKGTYNGYSWEIGNLNKGETANMTIIAKVIAPGVFANRVTVSSYENDTNLENNEANVTNITALPTVDLVITKVVTGNVTVVNVTDSVQFIITVINKGPCIATNVTVVEKISELLNVTKCTVYGGEYNSTSGIWYIGDLPFNGTFAQLIIDAIVTSNGTIANFVAVRSNETDRNGSDNNDTIDNITALPIVDISITKEVNVTVAYVGDLIKYTINVTNHGPSNATHVNVTDKLDGLLSFVSFDSNRTGITYNPDTGVANIGRLNANETVILYIVAQISGNGTIPNVVNVTSHENDTDPKNNENSSDNVTALPVTNLVVVKYSNVTGNVNVTNLVRFTINVTNNGPSNATWVEITDELLPAFEFVNATGSWTRDSSKVIWTIPRLNNGTTVSVDLIVRIMTNGTFENIAFAKSNENTTDVGNGTNVTADPIVNLNVTKTVNVTVAYVGDLVKYTINVTNHGPSVATYVNVTDRLDDLLDFVSFDSSRGGITYNPNTGVANIGTLNVNETVVLYIIAQISGNGTITNVVNVTSRENDTDPDDNENSSDNVTALPVTNLVVVKYSNVTGNVNVTDLVRFTINVTNNGPSNATGVEITDELLPAFKFVNATGSWTRDGSKVIWTIPRLDNGTTASVDLIVRIMTNGTFENIAFAKSNENTTDVGNGTNVTADPIVNLNVTKTVNVTVAYVGDLVKYTINVTNHGPSVATYVNVTDRLDSLLHFVSFDSSRGGITYNPDTGIANIGTLNVNETVVLYIVAQISGNGTIPNTVIVKANETDTDPDDNENSSDNVTALPVTKLVVVKYSNVTGTVNVTDLVRFTINVTNTGPSNATWVEITDELVNEFEFVNATGNWTRDGLKVIWTIPRLDNGTTASVDLIVRVMTNGTFENIAFAKSDENTTDVGNGTNITANPIVNLNVTKTVNVTVVYVGDLVKYTINVTNFGPSNATYVNVTDKLDGRLHFVSFDSSRPGITYNPDTGLAEIGSLKANESVMLYIVAQVWLAGNIPNAVNVTSHENETDPDDNHNSSENVTGLPVTNLVVVKYSNVTGAVNVTDLVRFTINVTNNGPSNATWVEITDELVDEFMFINATGNWTRTDSKITWTIPELNNGTTASVDLIVRVMTNGTFENIAFAKSAENQTDVGNGTNVTANPIVNLNITKTVNVTVAYVGDLVRYTINVTNHGPSLATDVVAYDRLDSGLLEFISFTPSRDGIAYNDITGRIEIGNLDVNESVILIIVAKISTNGTIANVVNVTSHENDTDPDDNHNSSENVTALPVTNLVVIKYSNVTGSINVTSLVKFTINVTNNGPSNATGVEITDDLLPAFKFVNATGSWTRDGQKITWMIPRLDNGTTVSVDLIVRVMSNGTFENIAFAKSNENTTGTGNKTNITADPLVDVAVNKTVDKTEALVGDNVIYTIYVTNNGPSDATDVYVTDKLDQLLCFVSFASNRTGITYDDATGIAMIGSLKANETVILYITARIIGFGVIPNVVTVKCNETDIHPENNTNSSENVTADKRITPIDLEACNIYYGDDEILNVTLPRDATGTVNITVNGIPYNNIPINEGIATLPLSDLGGGNYHVDVAYGGNSEYVANSTSGNFRVLPLTPTIRIEVVDIWHGEIEVLNVTVNAPGTVNITVYGRTITIPLDHQVRTTNVLMASQDKLSYDGKATWILVGLPVGTYPAYAVYNGNENYTTVSTSDVFHVRDKPSTVVVTADDIYVGEDAIINVQVGPAGVTGYVTLNVEGREYNLDIDSSGRASVRVQGLRAGLKHVYVKYHGDILYHASENSTTFKVLKLKPPVDVDSPDITVGEDGKITVTVPDDATGTITIKVNGKTYTQPVRDGKAVFIVPGLKVGVHDIEAFYSGDDRYLPAEATGEIEVHPVNETDHGHQVHHAQHEVGLEKHATGNPILMLIVVILSLCGIGARKFKK